MNDTIDVREGEALNVAALEPYLRAHLPAADGPFALRQFGGGHANLTYLVAFGDAEYVLRRPPHGPLPKGGHDMQREYRVLSKLYAAFPLAPRAFVLCTDHAVIGADFVVMERRTGEVVRQRLPERLAADPALRRRLGEDFVDTLAALHSVDYAACGLADIGRPEGYLARQLDGWIERWHAAETPGRVDATAFVEALVARTPESGPPGIVHNDFKLDNVLVDPAGLDRLTAVFDWDMCTVGDPLADLGYVLALWTQAGDPPAWGVGAMPTSAPGFPTRAEVVERYAARTGRDCSRVDWYHAFNLFRYAVIAQQIYARYERGQTADARFAAFGGYAGGLVARGEALADRGI